MKRSLLIPVKYGTRAYPSNIVPSIQEVAAHFDVKAISPHMSYSLHTEYSFANRKLSSPLLNNFQTIRTSHKRNVSQLWFNQEWSEEFAGFIEILVKDNVHPKIIEIHPPFNDYCPSITQFLEIYEIFERKIRDLYPYVEIHIENRAGAQYNSGAFLISTVDDIVNCLTEVSKTILCLKVVLDIPQLFTAHFGHEHLSEEMIKDTLAPLHGLRSYIAGIHIWGKKMTEKGRLVAHAGDLNDYFHYNPKLKITLLNELLELFSDDKPRYFVPEVNSRNDDLISIVNDFQAAGFIFLEQN